VDYLFIGVGTGGTASGIARYLKEKDSKIKVVGVDPEGSILSVPASMNQPGKFYQVEGIG